MVAIFPFIAVLIWPQCGFPDSFFDLPNDIPD
jgi:hypothetical protein